MHLCCQCLNAVRQGNDINDPKVACEDGEEYKRVLKGQLRAFTEGAAAKDPLSGAAEWLMLLVRPANSDPLARGPRKVSR